MKEKIVLVIYPSFLTTYIPNVKLTEQTTVMVHTYTKTFLLLVSVYRNLVITSVFVFLVFLVRKECCRLVLESTISRICTHTLYMHTHTHTHTHTYTHTHTHTHTHLQLIMTQKIQKEIDSYYASFGQTYPEDEAECNEGNSNAVGSPAIPTHHTRSLRLAASAHTHTHTHAHAHTHACNARTHAHTHTDCNNGSVANNKHCNALLLHASHTIGKAG